MTDTATKAKAIDLCIAITQRALAEGYAIRTAVYDQGVRIWIHLEREAGTLEWSFKISMREIETREVDDLANAAFELALSFSAQEPTRWAGNVPAGFGALRAHSIGCNVCEP